MLVKTPREIVADWLATQDKATRLAVVIDLDRLLADAKILDKPCLIDSTGREWQLAVFRGDELAFRLRVRQATTTGSTVVVLSRGAEATEPIDVSFVADVLAMDETGEPLDLSLPAFFRRIAPKISFPPGELRRFKGELFERLEYVHAAAQKVIERWGRPDSWGRGQVAAMVLLAHCPDLNLVDVWPDEDTPVEFLTHVVRLLGGLPQLRPHREVVHLVIHEAAREQVRHLLFWADADSEPLAAYIVLRDFCGHLKLQNPSTQIAGLQLFSPELMLSRMEPHAAEVLETLKRQPATWSAINRRAEPFLSPKRVARVLELAPLGACGQPDPVALGKQSSSAVLRQQLVAALQAFFAQPATHPLSWVPSLESHPLLHIEDAPSESAHQCRAALDLLLRLNRIEQGIAVEVPQFSHPDFLLDWFISKGLHQLELDLSRACHNLDACGDDELVVSGHQYLFGGVDELRPKPGSLKARLLARLRYLEDALAEFVRASPEQFGKGARSVRGLLRDKANWRNIVAGGGRLWVLIFDGMRFDSWESIVKPLLAEFFEVHDRAFFCVLPSITSYARTALLAGALPTEWKGFKGNYTSNERQLFAVNLGLTQQEEQSTLRFVPEADTTKARTKLAFADTGAAPINVLIYPLSDNACHDFGGDLASFNNKIRAEIIGNKNEGVRGILDDLLKRVGPEDTVVLSSDHGFVELLPDDAVEVSEAEAARVGKTLEASVFWRYVQSFAPEKMPEAVAVCVGNETVWVAAARRWFSRRGTMNPPRYSHGGLSLPEVVVPGAVLRRVTAKVASAELGELPVVLAIDEDSSVELPITVCNTGNCEVEYEVRVSNNLGEELLVKRSRLAPASSGTEGVRVVAKYKETSDREPDMGGTVTAVTIRLRHTDLESAWRDAIDGLTTIPVKVKPKPTKLTTDALKGFDDI